MKIRLFCSFIICFLILSISNAFGQSASFAALTGGLQPASTPITSGQSQVVLIGFSATVSGGSITFSQFNIGWTTSSTSQSHLANGTLYRCPTTTFNAATSTPVGNVTFSGSNITVSNLTETISSSTNNYFLVADAVYSNSTTTDYNGQININSGTFATDNHGTSYAAYISDFIGYVFNSGTTPYPLSVSNLTGGLNATSTTLYSGVSGVAMFGFSITNNSSSTYKISKFQLNSTLAALSNYFSGISLYSCTGSSYSTSTRTLVVAGTMSGSYVSFSPGTAVSIASHATKYYFLVANTSITGAVPANVQFNLADQQSSAALTVTSPSVATYNNFTCTGNTYLLNYANVTVTSAQTGVLANGTTITSGQTAMALFGFGISATSSISISGINVNSNNSNTANYFGNGKLYTNTSNTFTGSTQVTGATVAFSGNYANITFGTPLSVTTTTKYYFLVADNTGVAPATGTTVAFNFTSGQSTNAIVQTSPASSYNTFNITGNTYTLPGPFLSVTGANSTSANGITAGTLVYGQTDIVLFGFGVTGNGSSFTLNNFDIQTSGGENSIFSNARLYRSTTNAFPGGTPLYTSSSSPSNPGVFISGGGYFNCNVNETIPAGTTYYYWLVADYTVNFGTITSFSCDFASGQSSPAFITTSPYTTYNTFGVTGHTFTIIASEYWTGALSNDFTLAGNFLALNGGNGVVPGSLMVVNVGGHAYTNAPSITANTTVAGVTFGATVTNPVLNIGAGKILTLTTALTTAASSNGTINGGTISLPSTATSNVGASSTLTLSGTTVNLNSPLTVSSGGTLKTSGTGSVVIGTGATVDVAGTVTIGNTLTVNHVGTSGSPTLTGAGNVNISPAATLNVGSGDVLYTALTGKLTLKSDASGSASVGQITTTSIAGPGADSIHVERFITGGLGHRGYYLMSSPVYAATVSSNNVYDMHYLVYGGMYLTGPVGYDKGGNPSLFLYREDQVPVASFYSGNFWGVNTFNNTNPYDYNMTGDGAAAVYNVPVGDGYEVFFRGNRAAGTLAQETLSSFLTAPSVTLNASGTLNAGQITVRNWFTAASANLSYTTNIANDAVRGFNLVGNPYASSIDWETFNSTSSTTGIYGANISNTAYEYNIITHNYDTYQVGGGFTNNGSRTIVSGQGFFVLATGASPQLIFNESAKTATQNIGANLFMSTRAAVQTAKNTQQPEPHLRLQLAKDSINKDDAYVGFTAAAQSKYVFNEDALYHPGTGVVSFASLSADGKVLAINKMPLPAAKNDTVFFKVAAAASGTYNLNMIEAASLPKTYQVWLHDAFTKDSLNMLQTSAYAFTINLSDTTTYGSRRFSLVILQNVKQVRLVDFTANKDGKTVQLAWKTKNEGNNTLFTVERSVDKGITFSPIGNLTSNGAKNYSLTDNNPLIGVNEYRLKMAQNGAITYSDIASIEYSNSIANNHNLYVYPNPVKTTLNLVIVPANTLTALFTDRIQSISDLMAVVKAKADIYSITIVNNMGAVVKKGETNELTWQADVNKLMPGSYVIQVVSKTGKGIIGQTTFIKL